MRGTQPLKADEGGHELRNVVAFKNWERPFVYNQQEMKTELYNDKELNIVNKQKMAFPLESPENNVAYQHLGFRTLGYRTVK